ncbi:glycosyl hydrolase family 18 protein [uncultured Megasphaera sp.]|uniref:glycosyl hydrolase family 18 protein n=1 Tax=uncultured Megasphaera sp. TaxID=165188 RepID=UPI00259ABCB3|nr:glycosyl hydrolase family 18 protein [uncultured Megasphaera sp.]
MKVYSICIAMYCWASLFSVGATAPADKLARPLVHQVEDLGMTSPVKVYEYKGQWLVSPEALSQLGIYSIGGSPTYRFRIPWIALHSGEPPYTFADITLPRHKVQGKWWINVKRAAPVLGMYMRNSGKEQVLFSTHVGMKKPASLTIFPPGPPASIKGSVLLWDPLFLGEKLSPVKGKVIVSPTAFRVTAKGLSLRNSNLDQLAEQYEKKGYTMWPLVDNGFSPQVTSAILRSSEVQEKIIEQLIGYALVYHFRGYNLDFENINYSDKERLTAFVSQLVARCHAYGIVISMDITPHSPSLRWSKVYDRKALGNVVDYMVLMGYDQVGKNSSKPGPVATYPWVEKAIQSLLKEVPAEKVILGMPLYMRIWYSSYDGRDLPKKIEEWPPIERAAFVEKTDNPMNNGLAAGFPETVTLLLKELSDMDSNTTQNTQPGSKKLFVHTLSLADSFVIRQKYKEYIHWDKIHQLYYMDLPLQTGRVQIWFEEEKSLQAKMGLIKKYQLSAGAFWRSGFEPTEFFKNFNVL